MTESLTYTVAVRSLCEFTARRGDLHVQFTPAPSAQQGIAGHGIVAGRRGPGYLRELPLEARYENLSVRGRADGYDPECNRLEEFKTHRGQLERMPENQRHLHWTQLKVYGAMLCRQRTLDELNLALVYFDVKSQRETVFEQCHSADELWLYFQEHCASFLNWAAREATHRSRRNEFLATLVFPLGTLRAGQRQMAEAVYRTAQSGRSLMVQAPTGIGKTIGTLFPLLKATASGRIDKILFLVGKTSGRAPVIEALRALPAEEGEAPLRVLELVAKESACRYPGRTCQAASCPLARGFYDRLSAARSAAMSRALLSRETVAELASQADICPYYLTQELARWADVIVGDYSYFFDVRALLHGFASQDQWRVALLVDEAHNLVTRARDMYSATLDPIVLQAALSVGCAAVMRPLREVARAWASIQVGSDSTYAAFEQIPSALIVRLQSLTAAISDELAEHSEIDPRLLRLHFDVLHFCRMADVFGRHSLFDVTRGEVGVTLCIRNINPAPFLAPRFAACVTTVLFSATLCPEDYYRRLLGLAESVPWIEVECPFDGHQLEVRVESGISTRFRDRPRSLGLIAEVIASQHRAQPGNYLAFFSSYDYLRAVLATFRRAYPDICVREQTREMRSTDREEFLSRFTQTSKAVGFAVLGGAFAEGVDLPGTRLIGAFIATLGLPRIDEINSEIERRMQSLFSAGYEYTYLYPGLQKVVQAAGRVIRTAEDRGTLVLIDDRYSQSRVRNLLPRWWQVRT